MNKAELQQILDSADIKYDKDATNAELSEQVGTLAADKGVSAKALAESVLEVADKPELAKKFTTENVRFAELAQKALGDVHPRVRVNEETLVATYTFDVDVKTVQAKVKEYKRVQAIRLQEQRDLEDSLRIT